MVRASFRLTYSVGSVLTRERVSVPTVVEPAERQRRDVAEVEPQGNREQRDREELGSSRETRARERSLDGYLLREDVGAARRSGRGARLGRVARTCRQDDQRGSSRALV